MSERRVALDSGLEVKGGMGGEKHETRNRSQIWCFGTQHWNTRDRQLKSSARRTRCCKSRDLAQTRARQLLVNRTVAQTVAGWLMLHCFPCRICGVGVEQQAAVVRPRAHEAFSPGLNRWNHRSQSCTRVSYTPFQLAQPCGHTAPGREHGCAAVSTRHPGSWNRRKAVLHTQPSRLSLIWLATGLTDLTPVFRSPT